MAGLPCRPIGIGSCRGSEVAGRSCSQRQAPSQTGIGVVVATRADRPPVGMEGLGAGPTLDIRP